MKRLCLILCTVLFGLFVLGACGQNSQEEKEYRLYYLNSDGTQLLSVTFEPKNTSALALTNEVFEYMQQTDWIPEEGRSLFDNGLKLTGSSLNSDLVKLDLTGDYASLDQYRKLLLQAGLAKSFQQSDQISGVKIYINQQEILGQDEQPIGVITKDDYVESYGGEINSYLNADLELYFRQTQSGTLYPESRKTYFSSSILPQQVVLDELIKGPKEASLERILPEGLNYNNVTVQDDTCYIDFDDSFLTLIDRQDYPDVLTSIVNSLAKSCETTLVRFSVNGSTDVKLTDTLSFNQVFEAKI